VWQRAAGEAAAQLGASLHTEPDVRGALSRLLGSGQLCSHVLAAAPVSIAEIEALTGMADERVRRGTTLVVLGGDASGNAGAIRLSAPDANAIAQVVRDHEMPAEPAPSRLSTQEVRHGLNAGWLRMRFQPVVRASDLRPVGLESLARLHPPGRGVVHPEHFLPQAIACGQERVFTGIMGARAMLELQGLGLSGLYFSLNMPIPVFCQEMSVERAAMMAAVVRLDPGRVAIEVLETTDTPDIQLLGEAVERWRRAGFMVMIDDAGPGLPHWRDLVALPFTGLKLDRSLTRLEHANLAGEIATEAKRRGLYLVAEGIETDLELKIARELGADAIQGYLVSRPLPALAVPVWLKSISEPRN
jgi:EAL domain-containing protein (putative c-di-GMP-specific phosphodiesterase class I)